MSRRNALGKVSMLFVRKVLSAIDPQVDKDALCRSMDLDPDHPLDPSKMIAATDYYSFLEKLTDLETNPTTIPLRVGASMRCDDYGAFGLAWKSATDLRGSYARAERYARVLSNVATYEVEPADRGAFMHLHREGPRRLGLRLSNEATIASIATISREVSTREFQPLEVHFKHPAPGSANDHEAYFGCPVIFDSDRDALLVSSAILQVPNKLGDESISRFFETHLATEVSRIVDSPSLGRQVLKQISRSLSEGVPKVSGVAGHLCMSARTLQRKLADEGHTYQSLVDEARRLLSARLLQKTDYSLSEIAFMAGFADQSAFTRAFKRWEGQTPRSYRVQVQSSTR